MSDYNNEDSLSSGEESESEQEVDESEEREEVCYLISKKVHEYVTKLSLPICEKFRIREIYRLLYKDS